MKWLFAIIYHPLMIIFIPVIFLLPFMVYDDIKNALVYEIPTSNTVLSVLGFFTFWVYLAMKSDFLGKPYRKMTILLPLLQMALYTSTALALAGIVVNKWADQGLFSKGWAITLGILVFVIVRLCMSILYREYPLVQQEDNR
ncbi:hypothetical protein [Paenibacillus eucommiae]|uniref:Transmembrane protein n=1 Tax=Paenibacillus eucommiae TaxID=1355755 RepID=A0ABS4IPZ8_9BACL|nr:hypothetical protein [Paenibacillus eucommiae]MBP1989643.1 hypothetical protein [Paenibacillus eucommiae]